MTTAATSIKRTLGPWWLVALLGLSSLGLGILTLVWPGRTLLVLVVLLGIHLLAFGALRFGWAIVDSELPQRGFVALMGVLGIVAGMLVLRRPFRTLAILVVVLGLYWIFSGFTDIFSSIADRDNPHRTLLLVMGILSVIAGGLVLLWPGATLLAIAIVTGIHLILAGLMQLMIGLRLRREPEVALGADGQMVPWAAPAPAEQPRDDLTRIEGIGPQIAVMLEDEGITTYTDLASVSVEQLNDILAAGGSRFRVHDPASWPRQASLAAAGDWSELEALQDELHRRT